MYATSSWSRVYAVDAATGRLLWKYDPEVPPATAVKACCDVVNRAWLAPRDGFIWGRSTVTRARCRTGATCGRPDRGYDQPYTITGAPRSSGTRSIERRR
jgi:outer membrane protein assembly factor BamB